MKLTVLSGPGYDYKPARSAPACAHMPKIALLEKSCGRRYSAVSVSSVENDLAEGDSAELAQHVLEARHEAQ